ncbi:MBL fold metallo-hydrolase [Pseudodesulfovibrio sp. F-1]|uniref:MBL fold metallo-hydrolase n=1 Tax=Pseudodesulfovibrio alkaliphilus TaxID=2661613 RepID=A0A7K1KJY5_9BACT|nr:MBL fold metallo-hydrolase [Pseudodesulfovibrio alkaliphilus]MUM76340.1 MBL fold metallo-hydrolase [Pseudodesulfovibrio alkaliphilus]
MRIVITYICHNSFVLDAPGRSYLFDYPADTHLPPGAPDAVRRAVAGRDLTVFISHGHEDHLSGNLDAITAGAASVRTVLSDDVPELRPEAVPTRGKVFVVEADERYAFEGMEVHTLASNDMGVAFLVEEQGLRFYYGGDLAEWIWPGVSAREAEFTRSYFRAAMERVGEFRPHVVFSNADPRLANKSGGETACRMTGARVFVPMHTFGDTASLAGFESDPGGPQVFSYERSGDRAEFEV